MGEEEIEEVKEMKYLGYIMQKDEGSNKHIEERIRRATVAMKQTWRIGEKLFKEDFERRIKMFKALVGSSVIRCGNLGMERRGKNGQTK